MSKKSKSFAREKRLKEKRNKKATMKALYEGFRDKGNNTKSKRAKQNQKARNTVGKPKHKISDCGNPGCLKCTEINFKPFLLNGKPRNMPQWMFGKWMEE